MEPSNAANSDGRPEGRPSGAAGGETVSAFPLSRDPFKLSVVCVPSVIHAKERIATASSENSDNDPLATQVRVSFDLADTIANSKSLGSSNLAWRSSHLEPPVMGTLT